MIEDKKNYDEFPKLAQGTFPERVRFYPTNPSMRDWQEFTRNMTPAELLEVKQEIEKQIFRRLGS